MSGEIQVVAVARNDTIAKLVERCARDEMPFSGPGSICEAFSQMGYSHRGLYEAVLAAKRALEEER